MYQVAALAVSLAGVIRGLRWFAKKAFFVAVSALAGIELEEE